MEALALDIKKAFFRNGSDTYVGYSVAVRGIELEGQITRQRYLTCEGASVVVTWERQYHEGGLDALKSKPRGHPRKMAATRPPAPQASSAGDTRTLGQLRKGNEYLRAEVAYL